jgi:hypothetical protein
LVVEVGCWSSSPTPSPAEAPTKPPTEGPGEQAERALRADAPFDLALPAKVPPRRHDASNKLLVACRAGHHTSCGLLLHVATSESALEVGLADVVAQCQKRDLPSCHAIPPLPAHPLLPAGLPGELGRMLSTKPRAPSDDEAVQLRRECRDGFEYSCKVLAERSPNLEERREMHDKMSLAAREGCRRKLPYACELVEPDWPEEDRLGALDWNCQIQRSKCNRLGAALLVAGRTDDARNEYERACQYGRDAPLCLELAELYREGKLAEPVPGRGAALLHLSCASLAADGHADEYDECALKLYRAP